MYFKEKDEKIGKGLIRIQEKIKISGRTFQKQQWQLPVEAMKKLCLNTKDNLVQIWGGFESIEPL